MSTHNICFYGEISKTIISEAILMNTHNICFYGEISKTITGEAILMRTNNICFYGEISKTITGEAILMSTNNICFYGEISKTITSKAILMSTHNICFYGESSTQKHVGYLTFTVKRREMEPVSEFNVPLTTTVDHGDGTSVYSPIRGLVEQRIKKDPWITSQRRYAA